jgi:RNA polymerase sigma-70 factor (ECF subfamily)
VISNTDRNRPDDFASFMRAYQDLVYSTAARIVGNDAQAEDIAQDVFIKAYENFETLRCSPTAGGWLRTVARNLSLNHACRYRRRWRLFSEMHEPDDDEAVDFEANIPASDRPLHETADSNRTELIEQALQSLPRDQRLALVLYHFEDMPYEEISKHLGVSLAKVKVDIHRARTALARVLAQLGITAEEVRRSS